MKRHKDHICKCWCTLMISCSLDAKVEPVGKNFNEKCTTDGTDLSGDKDICAGLESTSYNFRMEVS